MLVWIDFDHIFCFTQSNFINFDRVKILLFSCRSEINPSDDEMFENQIIILRYNIFINTHINIMLRNQSPYQFNMPSIYFMNGGRRDIKMTITEQLNVTNLICDGSLKKKTDL